MMTFEHASKCKLWIGSKVRLMHLHGILNRPILDDIIKRIQRLPDRTPNETEFMNALYKDLCEN